MKTRNFIIAMVIVIVIVISGAILVILVQKSIIPDDENDKNDVEIIINIIQPDNSTNITEINLPHFILWNASSCISDVKIELYYNSEFIGIIDNKTSNDGKCIWILHDETDYYICGKNYTIKVSDYDNNNTYAISDYFRICIDYSSDDDCVP